MFDFKLDPSGDLELSAAGDISTTDSIIQAVRIRLLWFFQEWRYGPDMGLPYFEDILVKNPNESKIRHLVREAVMSVEGVTDATDISITIDRKTRHAIIALSISTDEETFREEVKIAWHSMD